MTTRPVIDGRLIRLNPYDELQVVTADIPLIVVLNVGSVEIFGEFLVPNQIQVLLPFSRFSMVALLISELQLVGMPLFCGYTRDNVQRNMQIINMSIILNRLRSIAAENEDTKTGPNVMVVGGHGRSSVCQTLYNLALKSGWHPPRLDLDPSSGVSSGQLDKILKGPGIINATLTECDNEIVQHMLNSSNAVRASDRLDSFGKMCSQTSCLMLGANLPAPLLKGDDRPGRHRKRHQSDNNRYKQTQVLFNIAKKNAATMNQTGKRSRESMSGDETQEFSHTGEKNELAPAQIQNLGVLPTSLSQWERFLRPLMSKSQGNGLLQHDFQHNKSLGVWIGSNIIREGECFKFFKQAAQNLMISLQQTILESNGSAFVLASGTISDCSADLTDIQQIVELGDILNATHYVVVDGLDISDSLRKNGKTVFDIDQLKVAWPQPVNDALERMLPGSEEYFLFPSSTTLAPLPAFPPPTKAERRFAGGTNLLEALNSNDSSVQQFIQAAVNCQILPRGVNHPLASRLLHTPTEIPRHVPQTSNAQLNEPFMIFTLGIGGQEEKQTSLRRVAWDEFLAHIKEVPKLHGALIHSSTSVQALLEEHSCKGVSPTNFYFTFPLHIASPVVVQKMVKEPGFQLWSRTCKLLDQFGFQALLILVDK